MSYVNLTNGTIYTIVKTGNPDISIQFVNESSGVDNTTGHPINSTVGVYGRPFLYQNQPGQETQQWRAISTNGSFLYIFQNVHSNVYLKHVFDPGWVDWSSSDMQPWFIYKPWNDSNFVALYSYAVSQTPNALISPYLQNNSECLTQCRILMGTGHIGSYLWNVTQVGY